MCDNYIQIAGLRLSGFKIDWLNGTKCSLQQLMCEMWLYWNHVCLKRRDFSNIWKNSHTKIPICVFIQEQNDVYVIQQTLCSDKQKRVFILFRVHQVIFLCKLRHRHCAVELNRVWPPHLTLSNINSLSFSFELLGWCSKKETFNFYIVKAYACILIHVITLTFYSFLQGNQYTQRHRKYHRFCRFTAIAVISGITTIISIMVPFQTRPVHNRPFETDHVHNRSVHNRSVHNRPCSQQTSS